MGGKTSNTPAPDYTGAAQATAAGNLQNLQYQTQANRPDISTPWGTDTWSAPDATGKSSETIALSPEQQQALNAQQNITNNQSQLAQTLQGQVSSTMANGFQAPQLSSYLQGVGQTNQNFGGFDPSGVGSVNQQMTNAGMFTRGDQGVSQNLQTGANPLDQNLQTGANPVNQNFSSGAQGVNTNAAGAVAPAGSANLNTPQFSDATAQSGAQSAYNAAHSLIADQQQQDTTNLDAQLRLQGLTPGTQAYNNAAQNLSRTQDQQNDDLASQAVQVGNNEANQNYASALAGYNSNLGAQNQAYTQNANTFALGNSALGQQYGQDASTFNLGNAAQNQAYSQGANTVAQNNAASSQQSANSINAYNAQNAARSQALNNSLSQYQAALQGQSAYNTAQGQAYNQALAGYGANQTAQQNSNAAQQQAYQQAMGTYGTAYQSAMQNYLQPLNSMNAVLNGNQVSMPSFGNYATAGTTPGTDYLTAANLTGQYNSAQNAANNASSSSTMGTLGSLGSAALIAY